MALYRNARRLRPYAACDICEEYRRAAVREDKKTGGHICCCCAAMRAKPNRETIAECPECGRRNAPVEKDHPLGSKVQSVFRTGKLIQKICLNCHKAKSKREDPLMKLQGELLQDADNSGNKTLAELIVAGSLGVSTALLQYAAREDNPQGEEELRDALYALLREMKNDRT
jgi:hypothetical protein